MALTEWLGRDERPQCRENFWSSGQTGERSRRDEDAERRKLVQGEFVGKLFGGRITMVWWLAGLLLRSFLSRLDESLCDHHPFAYCVSASEQAGQKMQPTTSSSRLCSATSSRRPST